MKIFPFFFSILLISCQTNTSLQTAIADHAPSVPETQSVSNAQATSFITDQIATIISDGFAENVHFTDTLKGSLFAGSPTNGEYIEIDFDADQLLRHVIPMHCQLVPNYLKAVCEVDPKTDMSGIYMYDLSTKKNEFTEPDAVGRWDLTSSDQLLAYTVSGPNGMGTFIRAYDFEANSSIDIGLFDNRNSKLSLPWLSNSASFLVGVDFDGPYDEDDSWYEMDAGLMEVKPIAVPQNIAATESVEWSPDDSLIAFIGVYRDDVRAKPGALTCGSVVLIYNPMEKDTKTLVKVPEGRCYDPFFIHPRSIWSPDGSKLALVLDRKDICIVDVLESEPNCALITNYFGSEFRISRLAWSPDSTHLAFIVGDGEIHVYALEESASLFITHTDELSSLPIESDLVWGR
jgi:WD40 repeat protein